MQNDLKLSARIQAMPHSKGPIADGIYAICDSAGKELVRVCRSKLHGTYIWRFVEGATYGPDCYNSATEAIAAFAKLQRGGASGIVKGGPGIFTLAVSGPCAPVGPTSNGNAFGRQSALRPAC